MHLFLCVFDVCVHMCGSIHVHVYVLSQLLPILYTEVGSLPKPGLII